MKTLGIVGGIGPESTIAYYRSIIALCREKSGPDEYPPIVIHSINVVTMLKLIRSGELKEAAHYIAQAVQGLERAGAELGLLAANTPHVVFDEVSRQCSIPLISIVQATADVACALGLTRLGLLGTRSTMEAGFFQANFASRGLEVIVPGERDRLAVDEVYLTQLVHGDFRDSSRENILSIVDRLIAEQRVEAVILGGTELPLLIRADSRREVPLLDTTRIHVERAVAEMLA
jgi:aspartate racemase